MAYLREPTGRYHKRLYPVDLPDFRKALAYAGDDTECAFAFSRRTAPEACSKLPSFENGGSRECRVHAAPAVSCA
jgi:hypothetical protein